MATGQIVLLLSDQGESFSAGTVKLYQLNGQSVSRVDSPNLSNIWPSGLYGAGDETTPMHMPNTDGLYLRGFAFNSDNDPEKATRFALSGIAPSGNQIGSYQGAQVLPHIHVSGSQFVPGPRQQQHGGGEPAGPRENQTFTQTNAVVRFTSETNGRFMEVSTEDTDIFDVDHTKVFYYICDS